MNELEQEMRAAAHAAALACAGRVFAARIAADHPGLPLGLRWSACETAGGAWQVDGSYNDATSDQQVRQVVTAYATALGGSPPQEVFEQHLGGRVLQTTAMVGRVSVTVRGLLLDPAGEMTQRVDPACWQWAPLTDTDRAAAHSAWRTTHGGRIPGYEAFAGQLLWWWHQDRCALCGRQTAGTGADGLVPDFDPATGQWLTGYLCFSCTRNETPTQLRERYHQRPPAKILAVKVRQTTTPPSRPAPTGTMRRAPNNAAIKSISQARQKLAANLRERLTGPQTPPAE